MIMSSVLILGACSKDSTVVEEKKVGFNLIGETIEEVAGVPANEKEQILAAFNAYIDAFNDKDIDRYIDTLSERTESFDKIQERVKLEDTFSKLDIKREVSDVVIVKYEDEEAQVFTNLTTSVKQLDSGLETNPSGRQVTLFTKDDGEWKVASVHYIGNDEKK